MATWAQNSFSLVENGGYLDRLAEIYPAPPSAPRSLSRPALDKINKAFKGSDIELLTELFRQKRFPFNDPFISFLRKKPQEIHSNPKTVERICGRLREMGLEAILDGISKPPEFNRQMGPLFKSWLKKKYPHISDLKDFNKCGNLAFLGLGEEELLKFANEIGCGLTKRPDFVAKARERFVIGEAKWIGTEGGNQNRAFDDAMSLASQSFRNAVSVAIIDGIIWIPNSGQMAKRLHNFSGNALTALLLDDFFRSL